MKQVDLLVIALNSPLLIGVYEDDKLIETLSYDEHASDALITALSHLSKKYNFSKIIYANTPGSFMGLKVAYVTLKSYCVAKDCKLYGVSGFELNEGGAIRANKSFCFVLENGEVVLKKSEPCSFVLPQNLQNLNLSLNSEPIYHIDAV